jgi:exosortase
MKPKSENGQRWHCPDMQHRVAVTAVTLLLIGYLFRGLIGGALSRWISEPQYSHGFVIPLMAVVLGWMTRDRMLAGRARCSLTGFALLVLGVIAHLTADYLYMEAADGAAFLICICGLVLLIWGRRFFAGIWPACIFLMFMLPLPFQLERLLSDPLQVMGADVSAWCIQTCGIPAIAVGNTILMGDTQLGVADACSGLRMLMVFLAISAATVIVSRRSGWEKLLIMFSAVPIALICNVVRIVVTAIAHQTAGRAVADLVFHDMSGWLMMPLAMLLQYLELRLFDWLLVEVDDRIPGFQMQKREF